MFPGSSTSARSRGARASDGAAQPDVRQPEPPVAQHRQRVGAQSVLEILNRRIPSAERLFFDGDRLDRLRARGREPAGLLEELEASDVVAAHQPLDVREREIAFGPIGRERHGFVGGFLRGRAGSGRRLKIHVSETPRNGEVRPRLGEGRVHRDGSLEMSDRRLDARAVGSGRQFLALQKLVVRGKVRGRLLREPLRVRAAQRDAQLAGHPRGDVRLDFEHVGLRSIEALLPARDRRAVLLDLHELWRNLEGPAAARLLRADRARQKVRHVELPRDLLRSLRGLPVRNRARARDDGERGKRRQLAAHFVGHTVGEIVLIRGAEVLEGENGDPLRAGSRGRRLVPDDKNDDGREQRRQARARKNEELATSRRGNGPRCVRSRRRSNLREAERDVLRGLETVFRSLLQAVLDEQIEGGRRCRGLARLGGIVAQDRGHRLGRRVPVERLPARQHLVENHPERENVGTVIDAQALDLLGRHVVERSHDGARFRGPGGTPRQDGSRRRARLLFRGRRLLLPGQAEVEDLHVPVLRDEEVLGLQVAVNDPLLVRRREALRDLGCVVDDEVSGDRARIEPVAECLALQQLHHGIGNAVIRSEVEDRKNVRVGERGYRFRLALEAREHVRIRGHRLRQHLDRDIAVELRIPRTVHLPHAARAEGREDLVGPEAGTRGKAQWVLLWRGFYPSPPI